MLARMSSRLFAEWMAYFDLEPWGEIMADARNASLMALLANIHRGEGQSAYRVDDFRMMADRPPQTWQEQKAMFNALTVGLSAKRAAAKQRRKPARK